MRLWFFPGSLCKVTTGRWEKVNWPRGKALRGVGGWPGHQFLIDIVPFLVVQVSQKFDNMSMKKKKKVQIDVFTLKMLLGWWITPGRVSHSSSNKCGLHSVRMHFGFLGRVLSVQSTIPCGLPLCPLIKDLLGSRLLFELMCVCLKLHTRLWHRTQGVAGHYYWLIGKL